MALCAKRKDEPIGKSKRVVVEVGMKNGFSPTKLFAQKFVRKLVLDGAECVVGYLNDCTRMAVLLSGVIFVMFKHEIF